MATSGSINFNLTRNEIVTHALNLLNIPGVGQVPSNEDLAFGYTALNLLVKAWQAEGYHLWALETGVLFLSPDTTEYSLSSDSSSARFAKLSDTVITQLSVASAASDTSIDLDTSSGMTIGDIIGIVLDDGTIHWTTIATIPTATSVTITAGVASAASVDNKVYTFTSRANRPLRIHHAVRVSGDVSDPNETMLTKYSQEEYFNMSNKRVESTPTAFYYDPQLEVGKLTLWPMPNDMSEYIKVLYERTLEDFDTATNTADFAQEWLRPLIYNLAVDMAPAYGIVDMRFDKLLSLALAYKQAAEQFDVEMGSLQSQPRRDY